MTIESESFRQADFIEVAIENVTEALRDGAILVVVVLFLFLGSWRTTLISAVAIPLSLVAGVLVVSAFGGSINTMTLGGFTIAIGALVDDAIIDVENVFRRLRLERRRPEGERRPALEVVFQGSSEVRKAIFFATLIIVLVFLPLFLLPGLEGRLLRPLGLAYVAALGASLLVSLTVTPVLCLLLLARAPVLEAREPWVLRTLHRAYAPTLRWALRHRGVVIVGSLLLLAGALAVLPFLGRSFLPPFNEGALTVAAASAPGIPIEESDRLGRPGGGGATPLPGGGLDQPAHRPGGEGRARPGSEPLGDGGGAPGGAGLGGRPRSRMRCWPPCARRCRPSRASRSPSASRSATGSTT